MVFFTGDQHFCHEAAIKFPNREYSSVKEMNQDIILRWNYTVGKEDTVYVLGDFFFGNDVKALRAITQTLHGNKILIRGNHDTLPPKTYLHCGFYKYYDVPILTAGNLLVSHEPVPGITGDGLINIHAHTHGRSFMYRSPKHLCVSLECTERRPISYKEIQRTLFIGGL